MKLKIDKEFKELIPPLKQEEIERLEKSILDEGVRDKLVVWKGTVVDGHNRYDICSRHGLSFQITEKEFDTREDVVNWIINNQLGRRNLTEQQKMYLRGKRYENEKKKITDNLKVGSNSPIGQNDHSGEKTKFDYPQNTTARKIADEYGVGPSTIQRDAWYSKGVDALPEETKDKIFSGEEKATKNEIRAIAKMEPKLQKKVAKKVKEGLSVSEAVKTTDPKIIQQEKDKQIKEQIRRNQEQRSRVKMTANIMNQHNITVCTKEEFLTNSEIIKNDVEIWIFKNKEEANDAKIEIRKSLTLKFNES